MSSSTRNLIAWVLQGLLGLAFIASGVKKFADMTGTVNMFSSVGLPGIMAYIIAGAEVLGGVGVLVPRFTRLAALGLLVVMVGAVIMHATRIPGGIGKGVPAIVLLAVLWLRRPAPVTA